MPARRPQPEAWPGRWPIALAIGALIIAAVVWWRGREAPAPTMTAPVANEPAITAAPAAAPAAPVLAEPAVTPYPVHSEGGLSSDDPLTAYRKNNVYPPASRPLTRENTDLLQPNQRHEQARPTDKGLGNSYLFTADRYFVIGDETITAILEVRHDDKLIPATVRRAYAAVLDPKSHADKQIPLAFSSANGRMISVFAPAALPLQRQTAIGMYIEFDHGAGIQQAHFDFQYTPKSGIPARFTGKFSEAVADGSLVIHAGVDVLVPGHYVIDCNLYDAADEPVAWTRFKGELAAGAQDAALLYFGKVLVDGNARGPFHIGQLRGSRYAPDADPDLEQMPSFTGSFTTKPYATTDFSDAEYDSADKRRMIELLGSDHGHRGGAGQP